jgi:hypothetical protein
LNQTDSGKGGIRSHNQSYYEKHGRCGKERNDVSADADKED